MQAVPTSPAVCDEPIGVGLALPLPPVVMGRAEKLPWVRDPEVAKRQSALRQCRVGRGQVGRIPTSQVRLSGSDPPVAMFGAQPVFGAAPVTAAFHYAGSQWPAAPDRRAGISEELLQRRTATLAEPDAVRVAQPSPDRLRRPVAVLDRALVADEDGIVRGGDVDLGAELRADDGHQLLQ